MIGMKRHLYESYHGLYAPEAHYLPLHYHDGRALGARLFHFPVPRHHVLERQQWHTKATSQGGLAQCDTKAAARDEQYAVSKIHAR